MKKACLCALLMALLLSVLPVLAEDPAAAPEAIPTVWNLYYSGQSVLYAGCAVQTDEHTLQTAAALCWNMPQGMRLMAGRPFSNELIAVTDMTGDGLRACLTVETIGTATETAQRSPMQTDGFHYTGLWDDCWTECGGIGGTLTVVDIPCVMVCQEGAALPLGALYCDQDGVPAGLVVGEWNEGIYRYVVAPLEGRPVRPCFESRTGDPLRMEYVLNGTELEIFWSGAVSDLVTFCFKDEQNDFYSTIVLPAEAGSHTVLLAPGHVYELLLLDGGAESEFVAQAGAAVRIEEGEPFDDCDFTTVDQYIGLMDDAIPEYTDDRSERLEKITVEALRTGGSYPVWQIMNTYRTAEEITMTLTAALTFPDGTTILLTHYGNQFIIAPELQREDVWSISLQKAFETYEQVIGEIPCGGYQLNCWFREFPAIRYSFEITAD